MGNHSGGNLTPDTLVFELAFSSFFGAERHFHALVHNLLIALSGPFPVRQFGCLAASPANAQLALRGRWRLRPGRGERTLVSLRLSYQAPGGLLGLIADRLAATAVRRNLDRTLAGLSSVLAPGPEPAAGSG